MRALPVCSMVLIVCVLASGFGCRSISNLVSRDESQRRAAHLQDVQLQVMRYADDYSARITDPLHALDASSTSPELRLLAHDWRIQQSTAAYTIASGPNPIINALDMVVLASLSRMVVETQVSAVAGSNAGPLLDVHRELETQSWALVADTLDDEQREELRALIDEWRREHAQVRAISQVRFADFAAIRQKSSTTQDTGSRSVFERIGLDPLSNLDPAVRELEQTRLLAERTIYYLQRSPALLEMQVERLAYQLAITPEAKQSLAGMERVSLAAESLGKLSADAPALIASERQALIADFTASLHQEQDHLQALLAETSEVLKSGTQTSDSVGETIAALDALVGRLQKDDASASSTATPRRPFDITEYTQTARELAAAARDLHTLLVQVDSSSASAERLASASVQSLNGVVDRAFRRCIQLIAVLAFAILLILLTYRYARQRYPFTGPRQR
ncbi:MAG TPA: hypothetical protein VFR96_09970 [Povalibacter sp.]|nr:hypothetical protein [Povalibacter sp.]